LNACPETHDFRYRGPDFAVLGFFVLVLTLPFWIDPRNLPSTQDPDALEMLAFARVFVDAIWNHRQFPMWNPYFGGGIPWAGVVWNSGLTPLSLVLLPFGEVVGFKLWFVLILFGGAVGMYLVCTDILRTSRVAALLSSALFSGSLWAAGRLADGNYCEFGFLLLPLCIHAFHQFLNKHWFGFLLPVLYLAVLGMTRYEPFLIALFVLVFALFFQREMRASYSAIILGWLGTFVVFVILALPKLLPLLEVLKANMVELRVISPSGIWPKWFLQSILYSPEVMPLIPQFIADHTKLLAVTMSPKHVIGIKITASALVLLAGILNRRQSIRLWILLVIVFLLVCGPYAPLPIWRLLFLFPIFNTMYDFTKYWNVFALFTVCGLAAFGFDAITRLLCPVSTSLRQRMVRRIMLGGIFAAAILHPFGHSFWINWRLFQAPPKKVTTGQFYQVASVRWLGVSSTRNRGPDPGVDETVMYSNLTKNVGTITWYGAVAFRENATPKFLINENGTIQKNTIYRGEVYCATIQNSDCDIEQFVISYNRLTVSTGQNFTEPSKIVLNFNYNPGWTTDQGTVVNHNGLLAVKLTAVDRRNQTIVLNYSDRLFLVGLAFFLVGIVVWPMWYFWYRRVDGKPPSV
jgi:hypothetical protein